MEELVGRIWHRVATRLARQDYPEHALRLTDVRQSVAILFRALGDDPGLRVEAATATTSRSPRQLAQRIAGVGRTVEWAWRDEETLRLPASIAVFPETGLNRDLYLWLAALAAIPCPNPAENWLQRSTRAVTALLERYPGLRVRYQRLVEAHIAQRPLPSGRHHNRLSTETAIRHALRNPEARDHPRLPAETRIFPVPLWLHPEPPTMAVARASVSNDDEASPSQDCHDVEDGRRRMGQRVDPPGERGGLLAFRLESLFTRAEYAAVDRETEETLDKDVAGALDDMDVLSLSRERKTTASRVRFDLDLPAEEHDDILISGDITLPEWDYRSAQWLPAHCQVQEFMPRDVVPMPLPQALSGRARKLRALFEELKPRRIWQRAQPEGSELDIDACIAWQAERRRGQAGDDSGLFRSFHNAERDLSCLLLADLSLSTDSHVSDDQRVIDVIRETLFLFSESLAATGDRYALYGFSSRRRDHIRMTLLKRFAETYNDECRGRIATIRPAYYTRMGAAIRYATDVLAQESSSHRLLLILTDGKPNDLDLYEGRYGIEDTRKALSDATRSGLRPFCVTIDRKADTYLPYLFGSSGYLHVRNARELPATLPRLYARLTA
ncbi:MAG: VWA domain-containing protein [Chromatiales bacterium]|nr:VWA domain-containing protein [Chromatiales bacterium]